MAKVVRKQRRSEKLAPSEKVAFKDWVDSFDTLVDAYEDLDVAKGTLERLLLKGSGHPNTIAKVRRKIPAGLFLILY